MEGKFRVEYPWYWTYWFTENGIVRVQLMPPSRFMGIIIGLAAICSFSFIIGGTLLLEVLSPDAVVVLGLTAVAGITYLTPVLYYRHLRANRSKETVEELTSRKSTRSIPWSSVRQARIEGRQLRIQTESNSYRMTVTATPVREMIEYLRGKIDDRLTVR